MDELADRLQLGVALDLLLQEVLDRLHVVIGGALDVLDAVRVLDREAGDDALEDVPGVLAEGRHLGDAGVRGQRLQPADFHQDAVPDQPVLAEDGAQVERLAAIAAVDGGDGGE